MAWGNNLLVFMVIAPLSVLCVVVSRVFFQPRETTTASPARQSLLDKYDYYSHKKYKVFCLSVWNLA